MPCLYQSFVPMTAPPLPAELIQQIARHLKFDDLIRYRQVLPKWHECSFHKCRTCTGSFLSFFLSA